MTTTLPHGNCYRVAPQFIAGEYPGDRDIALVPAKISRHLDAGITAFFDLTQVGELRDYAGVLADLAAQRGITAFHRRLPIRDVSVPHTSAVMVGILDALDTAIADGHTIYLHCWGGIGRTGTVVGCWLVRHGMTGNEALATISCHWQGVAKRVYHPRSPETNEQHAYVRAWRERP